MYLECKGKISNFFNNCLQESLCLDLSMIQITHFLILKILLLYGAFHPKIMPQVIIECIYEKINSS